MQTLKSVVWRRRWFNLYAHEIRLFKAESVSGGLAKLRLETDGKDAKPIQVVPLGKDARVSQKYEESQVQGSFKVIDQMGEVRSRTHCNDKKLTAGLVHVHRRD